MAKADRVRRLQETLQFAQKINEVATSVDELGVRLKTAYEGLFTLSGLAGGYRQGLGGTKLDRIANEIRDKRENVAAMQKTACHLLENSLDTLNNEQLERHRLELQEHLMHIEEIRRRFEGDLARVEAERSEMRGSDALRSLERQLSHIAYNGKPTLWRYS